MTLENICKILAEAYLKDIINLKIKIFKEKNNISEEKLKDLFQRFINIRNLVDKDIDTNDVSRIKNFDQLENIVNKYESIIALNKKEKEINEKIEKKNHPYIKKYIDNLKKFVKFGNIKITAEEVAKFSFEDIKRMVLEQDNDFENNENEISLLDELVGDENIKLLINNNDWFIAIPETFLGSKKLAEAMCGGKNRTSWCTVLDDFYFENYSSDGTLYYIFDKKNKDIKAIFKDSTGLHGYNIDDTEMDANEYIKKNNIENLFK